MGFVLSYPFADTVDTDGSGNADVDSDYIDNGFIYAIEYTPVGGLSYDAGVDFNIRLKNADTPIWVENDVNAAKIVYPTLGVHDLAGAAREVASGVSFRTLIPIVDDYIRLRVTNGGNGKSGAFHCYILTERKRVVEVS